MMRKVTNLFLLASIIAFPAQAIEARPVVIKRSAALCVAPVGYTPIQTVAQFRAIEQNLGGNYFLCNDLDFQNVEMPPIGAASDGPFRGVLEGNGKVLRNLRIRAHVGVQDGMPRGGAGIFLELGSGDQPAVVRRLSIIDIQLLRAPNESALVQGWDYAGALAGSGRAEVSDLIVFRVTADRPRDWAAIPSYPSAVGGVIGRAVASRFERVFLSNVQLRGMWAGGMVGIFSALFGGSTTGEIVNGRVLGSAIEANVAGGIVGEARGPRLNRIETDLSLSGVTVGGAIGIASSVNISQVNVEGAIHGRMIGGLAGMLWHIYGVSTAVRDCVSRVGLYPEGPGAFVGGIAGQALSTFSGGITRNLFLGTISGTSPIESPLYGFAQGGIGQGNYYDLDTFPMADLYGGTGLSDSQLDGYEWEANGFDPAVWRLFNRQWPILVW
ncbi:MAG: hypothetical protein AB7P04_07245 [Bacteriovoracia bacterium]